MNVTCRCGCDLEIYNVETDGCYDLEVCVECCADCEVENKDKVEAAEDEANEFEMELNEASNRIAELEARIETLEAEVQDLEAQVVEHEA